MKNGYLLLGLLLLPIALSTRQVSQRRKDFPTLFYPEANHQFVTLAPHEIPTSSSAPPTQDENILENSNFGFDDSQAQNLEENNQNVQVVYIRPGSEQSPSLFDNVQGFQDKPLESQESQTGQTFRNVKPNGAKRFRVQARRRPHALTNGNLPKALRPYPVRLRLQDLVSPPVTVSSPVQQPQLLRQNVEEDIGGNFQGSLPFDGVQDGFNNGQNNRFVEQQPQQIVAQQPQQFVDQQPQQFEFVQPQQQFDVPSKQFVQQEFGGNQQQEQQDELFLPPQQFTTATIPPPPATRPPQLPRLPWNIPKRRPHLLNADDFQQNQQQSSDFPQQQQSQQHVEVNNFSHQQEINSFDQQQEVINSVDQQQEINSFPQQSQPEINSFPQQSQPEINSFPQQSQPEINHFPHQQSEINTFSHQSQQINTFPQQSQQVNTFPQQSQPEINTPNVDFNTMPQIPQHPQQFIENGGLPSGSNGFPQAQMLQTNPFQHSLGTDSSNLMNDGSLDSFFQSKKTNFSCNDKQFPGYYADIEAGCQMFHVCYGGSHFTFQCPAGTLFDQKYLVCNWPREVYCDRSPEFYSVNSIFAERQQKK